MRAVLGSAVALVLACGATFAGQAKIEAKLLAGRWDPAPEKEAKDTKDKKDKPPPGPGIVIEFSADPKTPAEGKMAMVVTEGGKDYRAEGTFKLEGDKLAVNLKLGDREVKEMLTIKKLTDAELVTEDSKNKTETLRRKK